MNLDSNGLPVQADGDANDQLQRCGMIVVAEHFKTVMVDLLFLDCEVAITKKLQPSPGVYVRSVGNNANNVSADQLISALCAHIIAQSSAQAGQMFLAMAKRFGFAQNTRDGLAGSTALRDGTERVNEKFKIPDFMLLRALPLFARATYALYPVALIADAYLVIMAATAVLDRNPDHVDDNNTILTLAVCSKRMPTPLSWLACKVYAKLRPWNYGCAENVAPTFGGGLASINNRTYKPVYGALRWYHRAEAGGNPEIAEMWKPICAELFE